AYSLSDCSFALLFFTAHIESITPTLHDALPISAKILTIPASPASSCRSGASRATSAASTSWKTSPRPPAASPRSPAPSAASRPRSEEHTSELQSRFDLVCRLLLEKQQNKHQQRP